MWLGSGGEINGIGRPGNLGLGKALFFLFVMGKQPSRAFSMELLSARASTTHVLRPLVRQDPCRLLDPLNSCNPSMRWMICADRPRSHAGASAPNQTANQKRDMCDGKSSRLHILATWAANDPKPENPRIPTPSRHPSICLFPPHQVSNVAQWLDSDENLA